MAAETTTTHALTISTVVESMFLKMAQDLLIHEQGAMRKSKEGGEGNTINLPRFAQLSKATTPLGDATNPSEVNITDSAVNVTLLEYGNTVKVAKFLSHTSVDRQDQEKIKVVSVNMGETLDELARDALFSGATAQLSGGAAALSNVAASNTLSAAEVRKAVRTLETNKALKYADGFFLGKVQPFSKYDLTADSTWVNAKTYSDVKDLYKGEIGELLGVRFILTTNGKTESSTVTVYSNFIHGDSAFGVYDLEGDSPKLYHKVPGPQDTSNPADRYHTISWAGTYAAKVLVANWCLNVKSGATA